MSKVYSIKDITNYENHIGYDLRTPDGKDIRFSDNIEHNPFMYNEIKEIIEYISSRTVDDILLEDYFKELEDYITNLQESEAYYYGYYKDCKSRIDKARKMIQFIAYNSERPLTITELNKVYNILGGDDNENKND